MIELRYGWTRTLADSELYGPKAIAYERRKKLQEALYRLGATLPVGENLRIDVRVVSGMVEPLGEDFDVCVPSEPRRDVDAVREILTVSYEAAA